MPQSSVPDEEDLIRGLRMDPSQLQVAAFSY